MFTSFMSNAYELWAMINEKEPKSKFPPLPGTKGGDSDNENGQR